MSHTLKLILIAAVFVIAAAVYVQKNRPVPLEQIGMRDQPCESFDPSSDAQRWRYDWAENCRFAASNAKLKTIGSNPQLVMIGDSLTEEWASAPQEWVRRGIAGQTSANVLLRFRADVIALRPQLVHILVGTNDIAGNSGPVTPDHVVGNILSMVEIARANDIVPIIATVPPARFFPWAPHVSPNPWVDRLNVRIKQLAADEGLVVADYHSVLVNDAGTLDESLFPDGAHPNEAGNARMKQVLDKALAQALQRASR